MDVGRLIMQQATLARNLALPVRGLGIVGFWLGPENDGHFAMPIMSNPPDPEQKRPQLQLPPGACDSHVHLFGPPERYPFAEDAAYHAHDATVDDLIRLQDRLGLSRAVIVQATAQGRNNQQLLDALAAHPDRLRGVVVPPDDISDRELDQMHAAGVRGVRFLASQKYTGHRAIDSKFAARLAERGWHAQIFADGARLTDLRPALEALPCDVVIDHMGNLPTKHGVANPAFAH